jgi:hypothetical protein
MTTELDGLRRRVTQLESQNKSLRARQQRGSDGAQNRKVLIEQTSKAIKLWSFIGGMVAFSGAIFVILSWGGLPTYYLGLITFVVGLFIAACASFEQWWEHD